MTCRQDQLPAILRKKTQLKTRSKKAVKKTSKKAVKKTVKKTSKRTVKTLTFVKAVERIDKGARVKRTGWKGETYVRKSLHDRSGRLEKVVDRYVVEQFTPTVADTFAAKACERARNEGTAASAVYVHLNTSWHRKHDTFVSGGKTRGFHFPTAHSPTVIRTALGLLREIYRERVLYKKATVMLLDLQNADVAKSQGLLFETEKNANDRKREDLLMGAVDRVNRTFGSGTVFFGSQGVQRQWRGASEHSSPNYTLDFAWLPVVKAK